MRWIAYVALVPVLAGCAAQVVSSTPRQVIVSAGKPPIGAGEAQRMADAECRRHGRYAQMTGRPADYRPEWVFECVQ